jgi:hypothetical protein
MLRRAEKSQSERALVTGNARSDCYHVCKYRAVAPVISTHEEIEAWSYREYVEWFGISHLEYRLARTITEPSLVTRILFVKSRAQHDYDPVGQ